MVCKPWQLLIDQDFFDLACRRVYGDDWRSQRKNDTSQDMVRRETALYRFMWDVRVKLAAHWCVPWKAAVRYASPFEEINHLCVFEENEEYDFFIRLGLQNGAEPRFYFYPSYKVDKEAGQGGILRFDVNGLECKMPWAFETLSRLADQYYDGSYDLHQMSYQDTYDRYHGPSWDGTSVIIVAAKVGETSPPFLCAATFAFPNYGDGGTGTHKNVSVKHYANYQRQPTRLWFFEHFKLPQGALERRRYYRIGFLCSHYDVCTVILEDCQAARWGEAVLGKRQKIE